VLGPVEVADPVLPELQVGAGVVQVLVTERDDHERAVVGSMDHVAGLVGPGGIDALELGLSGGHDLVADPPPRGIGLSTGFGEAGGDGLVNAVVKRGTGEVQALGGGRDIALLRQHPDSLGEVITAELGGHSRFRRHQPLLSTAGRGPGDGSADAIRIPPNWSS
jgi:hypothetical protein